MSRAPHLAVTTSPTRGPDLLQWPPRELQIAFLLVTSITLFALIANRPWQVVVAGLLAITFLAVAPGLKRLSLEGPPGRMEGEWTEPQPAADEPRSGDRHGDRDPTGKGDQRRPAGVDPAAFALLERWLGIQASRAA